MAIDLLISFAEELRRLVRPVERALESEAAFTALLAKQGYVVEPAALQIVVIREAFNISDDVIAITEDAIAIATAENIPPPEVITNLIDTLTSLIGKLRDLRNVPSPAGVTAAAWQALAEQLLHALIGEYLESSYPTLYSALLVVGVVDEEDIPAGGETGRIDYTRRTMKWERLPRVFSDTRALFDELYAWNSPTAFRYDRATRVLARALKLFGLDTAVAQPDAILLNSFFSLMNPFRPLVRELRITLVDAVDNASNTLKVVLGLLPIPDSDPGASPSALFLDLVPTATATLPAFVPPPFNVEFTGDLLTEGLQFRISSSGVSIPTLSGRSLDLGSGIKLITAPPSMLLVGSPYSSRLEIVAWSAALRLKGSRVDPEVEIELGWEQARLVIDEGDGDGFLQKILPIKTGVIEFGVSVIWSSKRGIQLGGTGMQTSVPINKTFGPLEIRTVTVGILTAASALTVSAGATIGLRIGPLAVSIDRIGLAIRTMPVAAGDPPGVLGDQDFTFGFKPPTGIAIKIEAGPVRGGGFLSLEPEIGQYAGALQLSVKEINLSAIGVINTMLPDGRQGYSFLIIIAAEFPSIPLSFGFALNGVGGLIGIHRRMETQALSDKVSQGTLASILFPKDPVGRMQAVIADLSTIFPIQEGRFVFGPMVKLTWGPSALLTLELAVILDLPSPLRLAILGRMRLVLPTEKEALADIRLDVAGILDFDRQVATVSASLVNSRLAGFVITGDMAMILSWGATKSFALSMGGFFPGFPTPVGMPPRLRRLGIAMSSGDNPRLRLESYFAVTSNTVQFGAAVDLYAAAGAFAVTGLASFDALIQFEPFHFIAQLRARLDIQYQGAVIFSGELQASLAGPKPWHAAGFVEFQVIVKFRVGFELTVGEAENLPPQMVNLEELLVAELARTESWATVPAAQGGAIATLRDSAPEEGILLHPLGGVTLLQRLVPFDKTLTRFGSAQPDSGPVSFGLTSLSVNGFGAQPAPVYVDFAPGQFDDLSQDEQISRSAFESMQAGGTATFTAFRIAPDAGRADISEGYAEDIILDFPNESGRDTGLKSSMPGIRVDPERYVIANGDTLKDTHLVQATSAAQAHDVLKAIHGLRASDHVVIAVSEIEVAA